MNEPLGALAHLQLGRAYASQGETANTNVAYQGFLTLWKDAHPDIPIWKAARREVGRFAVVSCGRTVGGWLTGIDPTKRLACSSGIEINSGLSDFGRIPVAQIVAQFRAEPARIMPNYPD